MPDPSDLHHSHAPHTPHTPADVPHMQPAIFAELLARTGAWLGEYQRGIEQRPVLSRVAPREVFSQIPAHPPRIGLGSSPDPLKAWDEVFADLDRVIVPGLTHWQSPSFFGFFPANTSEPAVLGELLAAGLGVQGMLWLTSPACTELEMRVLDWLAEAIGLPESFMFRSNTHGGGVIQGTASDAVLSAMVAARRGASRRCAASNTRGPRPEMVVYVSGQAHSSVLKAAMVAGIADDADDEVHVRKVAVDAELRMRPDALLAAMREDVSAGRVPCMIVATLGTTSSTAIDPLDEIVREVRGAADPNIAAAWIHIDAAHAGAMLVCPEHRRMIAGVEAADSFCFNPHKWLLTGFDCDCFWVRDRRPLVDAMSVTPEYLRNAASQGGSVVDYRDWHVPLGRRFRSLKLWLVMRHYGTEGMRAYIREHIRLTALLEARVRADPRFEVVAPRTCNLLCVCLAARPGEGERARSARTRALLEAINASGKAYVSHTVLPGAADGPGRYVMRVCVGATRVQERHVDDFWDLARALVD